MSERFQGSAEMEARDEAIEIYKTLSIPRAESGPHVDLWRELLRKTRTRFEKFRHKPTEYEKFLFVPQVYDRDHDEELVFRTQIPNAGY